MYCSTCGNLMSGNMNYCNGCGAPAEHAADIPDRKAGRLFIFGGTVIVIFGLMAFFAVVRTLVTSGLDPALIGMLITAYLASIVLMFSVMMTLGWKQLNQTNPKSRTKDVQDDYQRPRSFKDVNTSQLPEGEPGFGSVTDSTTRTLEKTPLARN
jgi:hypothetical protein